MRALLSRLASIPVVQNALALFGARAFAFLLPLITIPYLARVLGPESWGKVAFAQALGLYLVLVIDYSFTISATRQVARKRDEPRAMGDILAGVLGAKLLLTLVCAIALAVLQLVVPMLRESGWFLWMALYWAFGFGLIPMFYFQGIENIPRLLKVDIPFRLASTAAVFLFVRTPEHALLALFLQASGGIAIMLVALAMVYRDVPFVIPGYQNTRAALSEGRQIFSGRISSSLYWMSNPVILGMVAPVQSVGFYAGAERVVKALQTMLEPVSQALFPQSSQLAVDDQPRLARIVTITTVVLTASGLAVAGVLYVLAPLVIRILLGPGYDPAVDVLRILLAILPLYCVSMPLVMQWIIPLGMDRYLMWIALGAGLFHIPFALTLAWQFNHVGVASAYAITEAGYVLGILLTLHIKGLIPYVNPWPDRSKLGVRQEQ